MVKRVMYLRSITVKVRRVRIPMETMGMTVQKQSCEKSGAIRVLLKKTHDEKSFVRENVRALLLILILTLPMFPGCN